MSEQYTYAVARIRALEVSLFSNATIEQLLACENYNQSLQFLADHGWGDDDTDRNAEAMLAMEEERTWQVIKELAVNMDTFDVLSYPKLFHNLKAAVKEVCIGESGRNLYYDNVAISGEDMKRILKEKEYSKLPLNMKNAAREAYESMLHTGDGQLCDIIIDKAALDAIYEAGKKAKDSIIKDYAESTVAIADIKIAVRSQRTGKSLEFMQRAMAECESLNIDRLMRAALSSADSISEYLSSTVYAEGAKALKESTSAFERWCDNRMIETIKPQKYNAFTVGPLVAYALARENEIKTVRIILTGKQNQFPESAIRERIREMYV